MLKKLASTKAGKLTAKITTTMPKKTQSKAKKYSRVHLNIQEFYNCSILSFCSLFLSRFCFHPQSLHGFALPFAARLLYMAFIIAF